MKLAVLQLAAWIALACTGCAREPQVDRVALWQDEARWVRWGEGWARAVPLAEARTVTAEGSATRLRAVAAPAAGAARATVRWTLDGASTETTITGPTPLDFELGSGTGTLASTEGVDLLRPRLVDPRRRGRRILVLVADTLRFDHAKPELMPEVDRYFEGGARFERAYSPGAWTLPSVASIFTGQLPARLRGPDGTLIALPEDTPTIASELGDQGYATVAVTANYTVHHENRYSTGFDLFLVPDPKSGSFADVQWVSELAREAASWLAGEDLYLYLQLMEAHDPYRNHESGEVLAAPETGQELAGPELDGLRRAYASEVRYLSRQLDGLLADLGPFDLAVFTADHGEELFDHGGFRHGPALFDETVRVPLWIRGEDVPEGTVTHPVSLTGLKDFLVLGDDSLWREQRMVTSETFSFGPPRWTGISEDRRTILFARQIDPEPAEHRIARWLEAHHPRIAFSRLAGGAPQAADPRWVESSIRGLVEQFAGLRRGVFLLFRGAERVELDVVGAGRDGWIWGAAGELDVAGEGPELRVTVAAPSPFALVFLPAEEVGAVEARSQGRHLALNGAVPVRLADQEVTVWLDPGPPERAVQEVEETLKRLEALGYI